MFFLALTAVFNELSRQWSWQICKLPWEKVKNFHEGTVTKI